MIVLITEEIPKALRGKLKLWFIEIKCGVFVSSVKDFCAQKVINYIYSYSDYNSKFIIIKDINKAPFYEVTEIGYGRNDFFNFCGLPLKKVNKKL